MVLSELKILRDAFLVFKCFLLAVLACGDQAPVREKMVVALDEVKTNALIGQLQRCLVSLTPKKFLRQPGDQASS